MNRTQTADAAVRRLRVALGALTVVVLLLVVAAASADAATAPTWYLETIAPTYFVPGKTADYTLIARNLGETPTEDATITDTLPTGVVFKSVAFYYSSYEFFNLNGLYPICPAPAGRQVTCSLPAAGLTLPIGRGDALRMVIEVSIPSDAAEGPISNEATLIAGGSPTASSSSRNVIGAHPEFGIAGFKTQTTETLETQLAANGGPGSSLFEFENRPVSFTQAGGHPAALTTTLEFAKEVTNEGELNGDHFFTGPIADPKDAVVQLPAGLLGDPQAVPRCPPSIFVGNGKGGSPCPASAVVGWGRLLFKSEEEIAPIYNVTPAAGESAEFAIPFQQGAGQYVPLLTAHLVHNAGGAGQASYALSVTSNAIAFIGITRVELTFWGVPADPSHDAMRGRICFRHYLFEPNDGMECIRHGSPALGEGLGEAAGVAPVPFLSLPSDCSAGPGVGIVRADSWQSPGSVQEGRYSGYVEASAVMPAVTGCEALSFAPGLEVRPDSLLADAPVGLNVDLKVPQPESPGVNATPNLRDAVVTLPAGMSISPGIVDGIQACDESGPEGINFEGPESEEVGPSGELQLAPGKCPNASTVGTAEAVTPLLSEPVKGHVYLARPKCGGAGEPACTNEDALDGNLYQLYLELGGTGELANLGINIKAHGYVEANPATGQITAKFQDNPQLPFSDLKISLNGGPRAPLDNPAVCGPATTTADLTPWSAPGTTPEGLFVAGTSDATPSSFFDVEGCTSPPGLAPGFSAGTVSPQGGAFSSFTMNLTRQDREQYVKGVQVHTPPGLLGMLSSVPLCEEPLADSGHCPEASKIGTTRVASGAGSHPFEISGDVYLTKGYGGAPFGLSIVTNAVAGPFNLGLVVVRARIAVNPVDSSLTITTDETGPYALPQIVFGVPLRLKQITVNIDRPGFMFNPTSCDAQQITAAISGSGQAVAHVSSQFAAAGCRSLEFKPKFTVSTSGHTSRLNGANLDAKLTYPPFKADSEANIAYVKVELPKQLPSRLTTLQKACLAAVFESNPGACPPAAIVGVARTTTPLLPVPLEGPIYFVSHGGEAFPSLVVVLQGDGVRVDLTGSTFISKSGITSTTFKTVPDVPVSTFELYLPEGRYSALSANANLCRAAGKLKMPTEFIAQNGATLKQTTRITVTGCAGSKAAAARARTAGRKRKGAHR